MLIVSKKILNLILGGDRSLLEHAVAVKGPRPALITMDGMIEMIGEN
jgi:hypothetical protein